MSEVLKEKLGFWFSLPFSLLALLGARSGMSHADVRRMAAECLKEWDGLDDSAKSKLHRVALLLFDNDDLLADLRRLASDGGPWLVELPRLFEFLQR